MGGFKADGYMRKDREELTYFSSALDFQANFKSSCFSLRQSPPYFPRTDICLSDAALVQSNPIESAGRRSSSF